MLLKIQKPFVQVSERFKDLKVHQMIQISLIFLEILNNIFIVVCNQVKVFEITNYSKGRHTSVNYSLDHF